VTAFYGGRDLDLVPDVALASRAHVHEAGWTLTLIATVLAAVVLSEIAAAVLLNEQLLTALGITP
jgi:hypothetical protein